MKKISTVLSLMLIALITTACQQKSLQSYLVKAQEKKGFITFDAPTSFIQLKSEDVSQEVKATLESIKKINVVALPYQGNEEAYEAEKTEIASILKDSNKYKSLMRMNVKGMAMSLYYTGDTESIDEVIAFGYSQNEGLGIARLIGENMNPAKIIELMNNVKMDPGSLNLSQFNAVFD